LDYRFDIGHSNNVSFIDDAYSKLTNVSGQLNYRITDNVKIWGAAEYKQDTDRFYWGTPLVPANFPGIVPTKGIVSGLWSQYYPGPSDFAGHVGPLNPVTIDARHAVHELQRPRQQEWRARAVAAQRRAVGHQQQCAVPKPGLFLYGATALVQQRDQRLQRQPDAERRRAGRGLSRTAVGRSRPEALGNISDLTVNSNLGGMDNRFVATVAASSLQFNAVQDDAFTNDTVSLVDPNRGLYGFKQTKNFFTHVDNAALAFEDRLKVTPTVALIGGIRLETIELSRTRLRRRRQPAQRGWLPLHKDLHAGDGRVGYTWEAVAPG